MDYGTIDACYKPSKINEVQRYMAFIHSRLQLASLAHDYGIAQAMTCEECTIDSIYNEQMKFSRYMDAFACYQRMCDKYTSATHKHPLK